MRNLRNKNAPANRGILETKIRNMTLALIAHIDDHDNPHAVTSADHVHAVADILYDFDDIATKSELADDTDGTITINSGYF